MRKGALQIELAGILWLSESATAGDGGAYGGTFVRGSGVLSGCYLWTLHRIALGPCLNLTLEEVTAQGSGPEVASTSGGITWLSAGASLRVQWSPVPWAALFLNPGLALATSRPVFAIDGVGPVHQVPAVTAGAVMGSQWIF